MVKDNNLSIFSLLKSIYTFDLFKGNFSMRNLSIYFLINLILISIINFLKYNSSSILSFSGIEAMIYTIFLLPILFLVFFSIFHTFIVSFEKNTEKSFWKSFLVFSSILLPFILIGHILTTIPLYFVSYLIKQIIFIVLYILIFYTFFNLIFNLKNYYSVSGFVSFSSFLLSYMVIISIIVVEYLSAIIG